jgi:hypothetical protein
VPFFKLFLLRHLVAKPVFWSVNHHIFHQQTEEKPGLVTGWFLTIAFVHRVVDRLLWSASSLGRNET